MSNFIAPSTPEERFNLCVEIAIGAVCLAALAVVLVLFFLGPCRAFLSVVVLTPIFLFGAPYLILYAANSPINPPKYILVSTAIGILLSATCILLIHASAERCLRWYHDYSSTDQFNCPVRIYKGRKSCSAYFDDHFINNGLITALWMQDARFRLCRDVASEQAAIIKKETIDSYEQSNKNFPQMSCCWEFAICLERSTSPKPIPSDGCFTEGK